MTLKISVKSLNEAFHQDSRFDTQVLCRNHLLPFSSARALAPLPIISVLANDNFNNKCTCLCECTCYKNFTCIQNCRHLEILLIVILGESLSFVGRRAGVIICQGVILLILSISNAIEEKTLENQVEEERLVVYHNKIWFLSIIVLIVPSEGTTFIFFQKEMSI